MIIHVCVLLCAYVCLWVLMVLMVGSASSLSDAPVSDLAGLKNLRKSCVWVAATLILSWTQAIWLVNLIKRNLKYCLHAKTALHFAHLSQKPSSSRSPWNSKRGSPGGYSSHSLLVFLGSLTFLQQITHSWNYYYVSCLLIHSFTHTRTHPFSHSCPSLIHRCIYICIYYVISYYIILYHDIS